MMASKKILLVALIFLILAGLGGFFLYSNFSKNKTQTVNLNQQQIPTPTPQNNDFVNRVESLPSELKAAPQIEKFTYKGEKNIREHAIVEKIIKDGKTYKLLLDSGALVTMEIDTNTFIGKAWFGINSENVVTKSEFTPVTLKDLASISVGKKVSVRYLEKDIALGKNLIAQEFVMLEE